MLVLEESHQQCKITFGPLIISSNTHLRFARHRLARHCLARRHFAVAPSLRRPLSLRDRPARRHLGVVTSLRHSSSPFSSSLCGGPASPCLSSLHGRPVIASPVVTPWSPRHRFVVAPSLFRLVVSLYLVKCLY